jgi:hypothetical protein
MSNSSVPLQHLVEVLGVDRVPGMNPLIQAGVSLADQGMAHACIRMLQNTQL